MSWEDGQSSWRPPCVTAHYGSLFPTRVSFNGAFYIKDELKARGARFNGSNKAWFVTVQDQQGLDDILGFARVWTPYSGP